MLELLQGWKASVSVLDTSMAFGMKVNAVELSDEIWGNFQQNRILRYDPMIHILISPPSG